MPAYYVLEYQTVDDFINRRAPFRADHLQRVHGAHERGEIAWAGAVGDPPDGALLVFHGENASIAEAFARTDPYVVNGLVVAWRVHRWHLVVGGER